MTPVTGDPAAMRAAAAQIRLRAENLGRVAGAVDGGVAGMTFAGPAASTFRANVAGGTAKLRGSVARFHGLADLLVRQAEVVEERRRLEASTKGCAS